MNFNILCNLMLWYFGGIFYFSTFLMSSPTNDNKKCQEKLF